MDSVGLNAEHINLGGDRRETREEGTGVSLSKTCHMRV